MVLCAEVERDLIVQDIGCPSLGSPCARESLSTETLADSWLGASRPALADSPFPSLPPGQPLSTSLPRAAPHQRPHAMNSNPAECRGLSQAKCVCRTGGQHGCPLLARARPSPVPPVAQSPIAKATATPPPLTADLAGPFFLPKSVWSWRAFNACFCLISQTENISKQAAHAALLTIKRKDHIIAVINH